MFPALDPGKTSSREKLHGDVRQITARISPTTKAKLHRVTDKQYKFSGNKKYCSQRDDQRNTQTVPHNQFLRVPQTATTATGTRRFATTSLQLRRPHKSSKYITFTCRYSSYFFSSAVVLLLFLLVSLDLMPAGKSHCFRKIKFLLGSKSTRKILEVLN